METKNEFADYLKNMSLFVLGVLFFALPLLVSTITTDQFAIPKQAILGFCSLLALALLSLKMIFEGQVKIRRTPFDFPIILFGIALFLSSIFAVNKADAITSYVLFLLAILVYFVTVNVAKDKKSAFFLTASLVLGGAIVSIIAILSFFKIYILPYPFTHNQTFTPLGSLLDSAIYLGIIVPIGGFLAMQASYKSSSNLKIAKLTTFGIASLVILAGFVITLYQLFYVQKPVILPFETGLQTGFAAISQDAGRIFKGFLFGSGLGTYATDFSRFKQVAFNQNQALWSFIFFRSSSFILELLATAGILGIASFVFLFIKVIREIKGSANPILISLILIFVASFLVPFSLTIQVLLFVLLALFAVYIGANSKKQDRFFDVALELVALRNGLLALEASTSNRKSSSIQNKLLPIILTLIVVAFVLYFGVYGFNYIASDIGFQKSAVAASKNNGQQTYLEQTQAIAKFPYRDSFYRVYSQTNLALANSLALQIPKGQAPDRRTQDNITLLIQQAINAGRNAATIAPQTAVNWQNLSTIYRNLIGFGQNADNFAIVTQQQSVLLDPNNPQQYLTMGGIYYQLNQWDNAQNQFQIAVNLKPDFPNAYYNLGHALQQKQDIKGALTQYEIVKNLVANNSPAYKQITEEIKALTKSENQKAPEVQPTKPENPALGINKQSVKLPSLNPKVKIPPPTTATQSAK